MKGKSQTFTVNEFPSISSFPAIEALQYGSFIIARSGWSKQGGFEVYVENTKSGLDLYDELFKLGKEFDVCLLYTSPSPRDKRQSRMPSSA